MAILSWPYWNPCPVGLYEALIVGCTACSSNEGRCVFVLRKG